MDNLIINEEDLINMQNKIIPKEKLISLEQFYRLTTTESNGKKTPDSKSANDNLETTDSDRKSNPAVVTEPKIQSLKVDHFKFVNSKSAVKIMSKQTTANPASTTNTTTNNNTTNANTTNTTNANIDPATNSTTKNKTNTNNNEIKKPTLHIQNQNIVLLAPSSILNNQNSLNTNITGSQLTNNTSELKPSRYKVLRNKVFSIHAEQTDDDISISPQQQSSLNSSKLSYLKRYVANGLAASKNGSIQFPDGHWGGKKSANEPTIRLKTIATIRTSNNSSNNTTVADANNQSNSVLSNINLNTVEVNVKTQSRKKTPPKALKSSPNGASKKTTPTSNLSNYQTHNVSQATTSLSQKDREVSIIDLQLPIKTNQIHSGAFVSQSQQSQFKNKRNISRSLQNNDYYSTSSEFNEINEIQSNTTNNNNNNNGDLASNLAKLKNTLSKQNSKSNSSILIESLDYQSVIARAHGSNYLECSSVDQNYEKLNGSNASDTQSQQQQQQQQQQNQQRNVNRTNNFLNKYLINQQKKKLTSANSANKITELISLNANILNRKSQNQAMTNINSSNVNNEILVTTSLNNLSSNSLLIKRLKF